MTKAFVMKRHAPLIGALLLAVGFPCACPVRAFGVNSQWRGLGANGTRMSVLRQSSLAASGGGQYAGQDPGEMFDLYAAPDKLGVLPKDSLRALGVSKARKLVHRDGDWHRSVHIWLVNGKREFLMQQRSPHKDTFPNLLDVSVGGHVSAGEDSLSTAIKETCEELGLELSASDLTFACTIATSSKGETEAHGPFCDNELKDLYLCRFDGSESEIRFSPDEVTSVKWIPVNEVRKAWESQDPRYLPRSGDYIAALFEGMDRSKIA